MFYSVPDLGLEFAEHPCTPRLATVKLIGEANLALLIAEVEQLTKWVTVIPPK